jgi:transposase
LYRIETKIKDEAPKERHAMSQEETCPLLTQFKDWLDKTAQQVLSKTALEKAVFDRLN